MIASCIGVKGACIIVATITVSVSLAIIGISYLFL
jgi:hypothetical protein